MITGELKNKVHLGYYLDRRHYKPNYRFRADYISDVYEAS